jgi:diguanylate cyclase (GGDEF)-like protein/PAS domain S-box-containing protein
MVDRKKPKSYYFSAALITAVYTVMAVAWVSLNDSLIGALEVDPATFVQYHTFTDWVFILLTALLVFYLALTQLRQYSFYLHKFKSQRSEMRMLSQFRKSIIDNASIWIKVIDLQGYITVWNKAAEEISGYRREEVLKNQRVWEWLYPDRDYRISVRKIVQKVIDEGAELQGFETVIRTKSGEEKIIAWNSRRFLNEKEKVMGIIAIGRDITEQKRAVQALRERENQLANLMDNLPGMTYRCLIDNYWTMKFVSSGCKKLTGYDSSALVDNSEISFASIIHEDDLGLVEREINRALEQVRPFAMEYRMRRRDGKVIWVWVQGQAVDIDTERYLEGIILDVNQRKIMEQELERMATRDPLTGLYNRRELELQLRDELVRAERYGRPLSLLWLDVDHFKAINDRYGHLAGDEVLRQLSWLLTKNVRSVDYVARFGGEELIIVLPELDEVEAYEMADRLRHLVETTRMPVTPETEVGISVSIGVATYPLHGKKTAILFKKADDAMYSAKQQGRNRVIKASQIGHSTPTEA